ncbi:hypothetical protein bAD24_I14495 [Burkholderia sp. AD24]|nr:hypothetical protein bAD24_I14495 [Burkholderia sp. AD24]
MKANELSKLLRQGAALLDMYEGKDLRFVLDDLISLKANASQQRRPEKTRVRESPEEARVRLEELALWADRAALADIEKLIHSDDLFSSGDNVRIFARLLGLTLNKRQSKDASIQTLLSHLDRTRLHRVISGRNAPPADAVGEAAPTEEPSSESENKGDGEQRSRRS